MEPHLERQAAVELRLPFEVADYVDFYSSREHATTVGQIFRPGSPPLHPQLAAPAGRLPRAGRVGGGLRHPGDPAPRPAPAGRRRTRPVFGPTRRLDFEAEVGFVVGVGSTLGQPVAAGEFAQHVFGFMLVNDWSARDIQSWETQPLGPFLAKSFATSLSPWVVPVAALEAARVPPPAAGPAAAAVPGAARSPGGWTCHCRSCSTITSWRGPPFRGMYWTPPQQLAHATANGAPLRTGDLFASGTVSGPGPDERGCLLELTWDGTRPLELPGGATRAYLEDGDVVRITATAPGADGVTIGFGSVEGRVVPAEPRETRSVRMSCLLLGRRSEPLAAVHDQGGRDRGDALAAAGQAQAVGGGPGHADRRAAERLGQHLLRLRRAAARSAGGCR